MLKIQDIIFPRDIHRLPKDTLKEVCTDLNLEETGTQSDLASRVWAVIRNGKMPEEVFKKCEQRILGGRTSIVWYGLNSGATLKGAKQKIIDSCGQQNPFEKIIVPFKEDLSSDPVLIAAANTSKDEEYFLRFTYKSGIVQDYYLDSFEPRIQQETITVYINEELEIIEIRSEYKKAKKIAKRLAVILGQQIAIEQTDILAPFGHKVSEIADVLKGQLIDTVGKPELLLEEFSEREAKAVVSILSAIDTYFNESKVDSLVSSLDEALSKMDEELTSIPFTALLLSGLSTVGLGGLRELRGLPLYDYLTPFLQSQNGSIIFKVPEDGISNEYSVKVGLQTRSITFNNPATEEAIKFVREHVILSEV